MKAPTEKLVVTFPTTTAAIAMETLCAERGVAGRLIPVPREITAGCGMAFCAPPAERARIEEAAASHGVELSGMYTLLL